MAFFAALDTVHIPATCDLCDAHKGVGRGAFRVLLPVFRDFGAAAARNGWAGVVIDGCVRDVAELSACAVGIRALASLPLSTERQALGQRDVAVQVQRVWVPPGRLALCRRGRDGGVGCVVG